MSGKRFKRLVSRWYKKNKKTGLNGYVSHFSVDYDVIAVEKSI